MSALDIQVGGSHYKDLTIQPAEYCYANNIPFIEGCVIKYVTRWRNKNGVKDLEKAKHFLEILIELENKNAERVRSDGKSVGQTGCGDPLIPVPSNLPHPTYVVGTLR